MERLLTPDNTFCRELVKRVKEYFKDPDHRKEFEAWYMARYGKPYQWKDTPA